MAMLFGYTMSAQTNNHVQWRFTVKKAGINAYSIHITALIDSPWYIYTQQLNHKDVSLVNIEFEPNAFIIFIDKPQEIGNPIEQFDQVLKHEVRLYKVTVNFVQKIQIVVDDAISLKGTINYVIGDGIDKLETHTKEFKITLND